MVLALSWLNYKKAQLNVKMFKDTKGISRSHNLKNRQWPNEQKTKELATQAPQKPRVDSATPERLAVPKTTFLLNPRFSFQSHRCPQPDLTI
jgi:hypothetical protein